MALKAAYDIRCSCGAAFTGEVCEYVLVEHDPELKDAILSGEFNRVACPSCGHGWSSETATCTGTKRTGCPSGYAEGRTSRKEKSGEGTAGKEHPPGMSFHGRHGARKELLVFGREALIELLLREDPELRKSEGRMPEKEPRGPTGSWRGETGSGVSAAPREKDPGRHAAAISRETMAPADDPEDRGRDG